MLKVSRREFSFQIETHGERKRGEGWEERRQEGIAGNQIEGGGDKRGGGEEKNDGERKGGKKMREF